MKVISRKEALFFTVIAILIFITYKETLNNFFLADDALWILQAKNGAENFVNFFKPVDNYWRPGISFFLLIIYQIFKLNTQAYYLICIFLHFANTILVYYFSKIFFKEIYKQEEKQIAFLSALIFSVLYSNCEAVIWIGALGDLFFCFFCLSSFIYFIKFIFHNTNLNYFLSLVFYFLALFFKESAIIFPLILSSFCYIFKIKNYFKLSPYFILTLLYLILYNLLNPYQQLTFKNLTYIIPNNLDAGKTFIMSFLGFSKNVIWIFKNVNLKLYPLKILFQTIIIITLILQLYFYLVKNKLKFNFLNIKTILFFLIFVFLTFLPAALFIKPINYPNNNSQLSLRYLYFPGMGFCLIVSIVLLTLFKNNNNFILKIFLIFSIVVVNVIPIQQTQWTFKFYGNMRKLILKKVFSLCNKYNKPYIFLINYPDNIGVHVRASTLIPLFKLYDKKIFFFSENQLKLEIKKIAASKICFLKWENNKFKDKTLYFNTVFNNSY